MTGPLSHLLPSASGPRAPVGMTRRLALVAFAASSLAACAAPAYVSPVEVTRFVGQAPSQLGQGTISIEPAVDVDGQALEFGLLRDAVAAQLVDQGYSVVESGGTQVATVGLARSTRSAGERRPVSVGGGANVGSYGSGVGLGLGIDLTPRRADEIGTLLSVAIRPAAGGANLWEGRASFVATTNSDMADPSAAAARAAEALFAGFPGVSGETVEVE